MGTIADKLTYLNGTKQAIKEAINEDFEVINDNTTFRQYAEKISNNNEKYKSLIPTKTVNATNTVDISDGVDMKALVNQYGNTYQKSTTGKNKINVEDRTITPKGFDQYLINNYSIDNTKTYTLSFDYKYNSPTFSSTGAVIMLRRDNEYIALATSSSATEGKITATITNKSAIYVYITTRLTGGSIDIFNVMLEEGSEATDYEEYTGETASPSPDYPQDIVNINGETTVNITQGTEEKEYKLDLPFELCKRGDHQDKLYNQNGKWYLYKEIGKVVYDGSENWTYYNHYLQTSLTGGIDWTGSVAPQGLCDKYICRSRYYIINTTFKKDKSISLGASFLALYDSNFTDVTSFKTWLSTHNIIVYYQLATPTTEEITESNYPTLYNQLNAIKLFEGTNHITVTNESGLDVEFDVVYYKDWKLD
jgi:hypothetical protein